MFLKKLKVFNKIFSYNLKHIRNLFTPVNIFNTKMTFKNQLLNMYENNLQKNKYINFNIFNSNLNSLSNDILLIKMSSNYRLDSKFHYRIGNYG